MAIASGARASVDLLHKENRKDPSGSLGVPVHGLPSYVKMERPPKVFKAANPLELCIINPTGAAGVSRVHTGDPNPPWAENTCICEVVATIA